MLFVSITDMKPFKIAVVDIPHSLALTPCSAMSILLTRHDGTHWLPRFVSSMLCILELFAQLLCHVFHLDVKTDLRRAILYSN